MCKKRATLENSLQLSQNVMTPKSYIFVTQCMLQTVLPRKQTALVV